MPELRGLCKSCREGTANPVCFDSVTTATIQCDVIPPLLQVLLLAHEQSQHQGLIHKKARPSAVVGERH